jgi:aspartokinase
MRPRAWHRQRTDESNRQDHGPLAVWKFGGASLADAPAIRKAADLIAAHNGPLVVVCLGARRRHRPAARRSALSMEGQDRQAATVAAGLLVRHRKIVRDLVPPGRLAGRCCHRSTKRRASTAICARPSACSARGAGASDMIVSRGERLSAPFSPPS